MINLKKLIISIFIPLAAGGLGFLLGGKPEIYNAIVKPSFSPPGWVFPVAWTILYILMGISFYIVYNSDSIYRKRAIIVYFIQLTVNMLWSLLFFRLHLYLISALWIVLLILLVAYMVYLFFKINKKAGYLQIPYLLWLTFACVLNFAVYFLNAV
jgi:tryptophan-rich sensory protein